MGLGTLVLIGRDDEAARTGPATSGRYILERWTYTNADATRTNDYITCKQISKVKFVRGANQDTRGATAAFTIDNTVSPPTVTVNGVVTTESGEVDIYGL